VDNGLNVSAYAVNTFDGIHGNIPKNTSINNMNKKKGSTKMKMITRTISESRYTVRCMNVKTCEVSDMEYSLGSLTFNTEKKTLEALRSRYETADFKLVAIINKHSVDALYAMTEEAFIRNAIAVKDVKEAREYFKSHGEEIEEV